jgi:hypothetical protein
MAYVPVPKDLSRVKSKIAFNMTKRQLVCFGGGALLGVPLFFLTRGPLGNSTAAMCMVLMRSVTLAGKLFIGLVLTADFAVMSMRTV